MSLPADLDGISDDPSPELCREVYAHYGVCMAASQALETHLISMLTAYQTANDPAPSTTAYDRYLICNEKLTLGNLVKGLRDFGYIGNLEGQVAAMKADRDFLAHRFFRERNDDFFTVAGCLRLISDLNSYRAKFDDVLTGLESIETELTKKLGYHSSAFKEKCLLVESQLTRSARSRFGES
jgi:hypothetical protein